MIDAQFSYDTFEPMYGEMIVFFVLLFHDGSLIHEFVGEFDFAFVVSFDTSFVKHLQGQLRVLLTCDSFGVDEAKVVIGLNETLLFGFG